MPDPNDSCSYEHDALGRLKLETRQDSSTVELFYDLAGRMTDREYSDNTTDEFGYDGASRLTSAIKGRHAITVNRSYADDGQMESESYVLDGRTYTLERTYYADNRVETQTFADGKVMEWIYDARRLVTEVHYDGDLVLGQDHDDGHRLTQQTFANGLVRDIAYTRQDNLRSSDTVRDGATPIDELAFTYAYFPDKNVEKETQAAGTFGDLSFTATYDDGNRVASYNRLDNYPGARETQTWDYDGAGNWDSTTIDGTTQSRDHSDSDQLEQIGTANLSYDPRGNLLADERGNDYTWDLDNRITKAEGSGYTDIEYRYDALGRRIVREQGSQKEVLLWWGNTEQSEHKHQALQTTIQNDLQANPSEEALNTVFARALEGDKQDIQYFHKNYLDHVMAVSDDSGDLLEHYRYTAFGEPEIYDPTGDKLTSTDIDNDILWNVRRYEPATGHYMYLYRDYDTAAGRWPSRDPIEERGGINLYGFGENDGIGRLDYLGLFIKDGNWKKWSGMRGEYEGEVCAEDGDDSGELMRLIIGPEAETFVGPPVTYQKGQKIDVSGLLAQLESIMRREVIAAVNEFQKLNIAFIPNHIGSPGQGSELLDLLFSGQNPNFGVECFGAALLTHSRGLQKSLFDGEFDRLGGISALGRNLGVNHGGAAIGPYEENQNVGTKKALNGDWTSFQGWTNGGNYASENVINMGGDNWWGHPQGTMSEQKWYDFLKTQGGGSGSSWIGTNGIIHFIDSDKVASSVWPWRGGN